MTTPAPQNPNTTKPADDPDTHWRESLAQAPYYKAGYSFDDYAPAYRAGREARGKAGGKSWAEAENALRADWDRAYSREAGCFPPGAFRVDKYWPPVGRVDNVYGDRNLFCSCIPVGEYA